MDGLMPMFDNELLRVNYRGARRSRPRPIMALDDPNPFQLGFEWLTGTGPDHRYLGVDSQFSRAFANAWSVQDHLKRAVADWRDRRGGDIREADRYTDYRGVFDLPEVAKDSLRPNAAGQFTGSFSLEGQRRGDRIYWTARNKSGTNSLFYGRKMKSMWPGGPTAPDISAGYPGGAKTQAIDLVTDLAGVPILQR